jgi:hypothetical protein
MHGLGLAAMTTVVIGGTYADDFHSPSRTTGERKEKNMGRPLRDERPEVKAKSSTLKKMLKRKGRV